MLRDIESREDSSDANIPSIPNPSSKAIAPSGKQDDVAKPKSNLDPAIV